VRNSSRQSSDEKTRERIKGRIVFLIQIYNREKHKSSYDDLKIAWISNIILASILLKTVEEVNKYASNFLVTCKTR
jgi:hypothetical protein